MGGAKIPHLSVVKTVSPATALVGDTVRFSIKVTNDGTVQLTDIKLQDPQIPSANVTIAKLDPGESYEATDILYTVTAADAAAGSYTNTATADAAYSDQKVPVVDGSATVTVTAPNPSLKVYKSSTVAFARVGDTVTYTVEVKNSGNVPLMNIAVSDDKSGDTWTIASLAVGASDTHTVICTMTAVGAFTNTATASTTYNGTPVTANDHYTVNVSIVDTPSLRVDKSSTVAFARVGDMVTYTIVVRNSGNVPLTNIVVSDDKSGDTWTIASLAVGASDTHTVTCTMTAVGAFTNTATATTTYNGAPIAASDNYMVTVTAAASELAITKVADQAVVSVGDTVRYTITVTNNGLTPLANVRVTDAELSVTSVIPNIPAQTAMTSVITHIMQASDADPAGMFTNHVTAVSQSGLTAFAQATVTVVGVGGQGNLVVSKTVAGAGGDLTKAFDFTVRLNDNTITGAYGGMAFHAGIATFRLKHGESVTASGLPGGIDYLVIETADSAYTTTATGDSGTIVAGSTSTAAFVNTIQPGSLAISNTVYGSAADLTLPFRYTVTFGDRTLNGVYGGATLTAGIAQFTLTHAQNLLISGLPSGASYTVAQTPESGYRTSYSGSVGVIAAGITTNAAFVNVKEGIGGTLTITKQVRGSNTSAAFRFHLSLRDASGGSLTGTYLYTGVNGAAGGWISSGEMDFYLADQESIVLDGLPDGTRYAVTEYGSRGYTSRSSGSSGTISSAAGSAATFINTYSGSSASVPKTGYDDLWPKLIALLSIIGVWLFVWRYGKRPVRRKGRKNET